ncbi:MAG: imidazole glycerol phosphate synthase subunit HisH [Spirochaetaceae bacterium]|jgi:imidazole glycerol phosphate synthase glutamine amidotransferase subunit|nr:imidazole glycerol phosphate synthase subunit HisH [Spirochaetaceae bacterium]
MTGAGLTGLVDYGAGNMGSVMNALGRLGAPFRRVQGPEELSGHSPFEKIIFPGDGHFGSAMDALDRSGYSQALREWITADKPFLGICIGLQILFQCSDEAPEAQGLGVITGGVARFPGAKVPHIGWNSTRAREGSRLFTGIPADTFFYYIHSYYAAPADVSLTAACAEYYLPYCAALERGALGAVQFHPEKSGAWGLKLLENWLGGGNAG